MTTLTLPQLPRALTLAARPLPLAPLSLMLTSLTRLLTRRHPGLLRRLGAYADRRFLLDLTHLPFLLLLEPGGPSPKVTAHARRRAPVNDVRIAGLTAAFLGMMHGSLDGDALFFSRDLVIEGDTATAKGRMQIDRRDFGIGAGYADESTVGFAVGIGFDLTARRQ